MRTGTEEQVKVNAVARIEERVTGNLARLRQLEAKVAELITVLDAMLEITRSTDTDSGIDRINLQVCRTMGMYRRLQEMFENSEYSDFF